MVARVIPVDCFDLVIFGGNGRSGPAQNLARPVSALEGKGRSRRAAPSSEQRAAIWMPTGFAKLCARRWKNSCPRSNCSPKRSPVSLACWDM